MDGALCEFDFAWPSDALCEAAAFADNAAFFKFALCATVFFEAEETAAEFLETSEAAAGFLGAAVFAEAAIFFEDAPEFAEGATFFKTAPDFAEAATVFGAAEFFCETEEGAFPDDADFFEAAAFTDAGFAEGATFFEDAPEFAEAATFFETALCASDFFAALFCGFFTSDVFSSNLPREFASADFFCTAGEGAIFFETDSAFLETAAFADDVLRAAELLDFPPIMIFYRKKVFLARGRKSREARASQCVAAQRAAYREK